MYDRNKPLIGKTALITGASRGLGRAYAIRLAELGANVAVTARNLHSYLDYEAEAALMTADTTVDECLALGVQAIGIEADFTKKEAVFSAIETIEKKFGSIDICVCNAGGGVGAPSGNKAGSLNWNDFYAVMEKNLYSTVYTCNAVVLGMKERCYGKIINVISVGGLLANSDGSYSHYATAKAAIAHYTRSLAQECGPYNITVNALAPGFIKTGRLEKNFKQAGEKSFLRNVAMKRFGTLEDCANAIEFLSTDLSSYVTGTVLDVTGGIVGRMIMNED